MISLQERVNTKEIKNVGVRDGKKGLKEGASKKIKYNCGQWGKKSKKNSAKIVR